MLFCVKLKWNRILKLWYHVAVVISTTQGQSTETKLWFCEANPAHTMSERCNA